MLVVRAARPGDALALTRLHVAGLGTCIGPAWTDTHTADLTQRLNCGDPDLIACVAELTGSQGLVSAAVGFVHTTLARPDNPLGRTAHLASVTTHPACRRRGYARATVRAWLAAAADRHCAAVTLTATEQGRALYQSFGFEPQPASMRLALTPGQPNRSAVANPPGQHAALAPTRPGTQPSRPDRQDDGNPNTRTHQERFACTP